MSTNSKKPMVRIMLMSRIDHGSPRFRRGNLKRAADIFTEWDCDIPGALGGIFAGEDHAKEEARLKREEAMLKRQLKTIFIQLRDLESLLRPKKKGRQLTAEKRSELEKMKLGLKKQEGEHERLLEVIWKRRNEMLPENRADAFAAMLPPWKNKAGDHKKFYLMPSEAYDKQIGIEACRLLVERHYKQIDMRQLEPGASRLPLREIRDGSIVYVQELEAQTPQRRQFRGDYISTRPDRIRKDRIRQSSNPKTPDLRAIGGYGVFFSKPEGEAPEPYFAVPALCNVEDDENQIGVIIIDVYADKRPPVVHSIPFKDQISQERHFIGMPGERTPVREKCIEIIRTSGKRSTGVMAGETKLSRETIKRELTPLIVKRGDAIRKTWPGLTYDLAKDEWDFNYEWVRQNLEYPLPSGEHKVDKLVAFACLHAGSHDTDYEHFRVGIPKVVLETGATGLVGAGDFVEGLAHDALARGEIHTGANITVQEVTAGWLVGQAVFEVHKVRMDDLLKENPKPSPKELQLMLTQSILDYRWIEGNHDLWVERTGHTACATKIAFMNTWLRRAIAHDLKRRGLSVDGLELPDLVASKIITSVTGRFVLPSGLPMSISHPHMARAGTASIRAQAALNQFADCPVTIEANFHVAVHVEDWHPKYGQRTCIQVPTMKHGSPFEMHKQKIVDQGFYSLQVESVLEDNPLISPEYRRPHRIVRTTTGFHCNKFAKELRLDPMRPVKNFWASIGLYDETRDFQNWKSMIDAFLG